VEAARSTKPRSKVLKPKTVFYVLKHKTADPFRYLKSPTARTTTGCLFEALQYPEEFQMRAYEAIAGMGKDGKDWKVATVEVTIG
jgi:hypothetical protein